MKLLIIGGSGFLIGTLARAALAAGHETWVGTRGQRPLTVGLNALEVDRKDRTSFAARIKLVVDCTCFSAQDAAQDVEVFTGLCKQLVFIPTDFVYQTHPRPYPVSENFADFILRGYGASKRQAEETFVASNPDWTILRLGHIYGPGSELGCLPEHGRDPDLLDLKQGLSLKLVGGGHFLQQPIFAEDLARMILNCAGKPPVKRQIFNAPGASIVSSWRYYNIIAEHLGVPLHTEEVAITGYLEQNPDKLAFCAHRVYTTNAATQAGLYTADTPIEQGLRVRVDALLG